ncbi:amidase family protein [Streptomyces tubbatahanensis]|uniref:Amidase family protein n=1 Tax=Streptomyces tubbatahanensis TaxID=2923272 RepID=A0ABY3Y112_9ACTN|nr:amidase family protein [Streptomyces tubbatahanensis]UNT00515.1 amidase family protein [Streptomyces tubbatahanensis]
MDDQVDRGDATATAEAIRSGVSDARAVTERAIARIEKLDPGLNAVIHRRFAEALAEIDAGLPDGPLRGVPVLVKDLGTQVAGLPAAGGSRLFSGDVADRDSELVARYRRAGMVVLGTTNTPELGLNASTEPTLHGPTRNPWSAAHSPGGSSGGSAAAVAAGMVPVAHASDGGGSIRIPSAACGLFGLKPSRGRVSPAPQPSTLSGLVSGHHAVTTTVRDSALLLDIAAGPLPGDAYAAPTPSETFTASARRDPGRLRVGLITALPDGPAVHPASAGAAVAAARLCERLGHEVTELSAPYRTAEVGPASAVVMGSDLVARVDARLDQLGRQLAEDDLEPFTRLLYDTYSRLGAADVSRALRRIQEIGWEVGAAFRTVDVLLSPTLAQPTPRIGLLDTRRPETVYEHASVYAAFTSVHNVTGMPAMSVPLGRDGEGLPLGVQFAADLGGEGLLLSLAAQLEAAAPWPRGAVLR